MTEFSNTDRRFMAACLRYARRHQGLSGTNPSVGTLLVRDDIVVGRGITARGGRPHAESVAIAMAGDLAKGSTAYVSLEPCAHHGATPPCAQTLIDAGVLRVVTAWIDPDVRVDGKGHQMLRDAGIVVETGLLGEQAARDLGGYLCRKQLNRPHVTLKLAISKDGMLGRPNEEVPITGELSRSYVHRMRAGSDAILIGTGTALADDPNLTCRLPGLDKRSPVRFVLDVDSSLPADLAMFSTAAKVPTHLITAQPDKARQIHSGSIEILVADIHQGRVALPEVLVDMADTGISSLLVEGGAKVAQSFIEGGLVDTLALFTSSLEVGHGGIPSPIRAEDHIDGFETGRIMKFGDDRLHLYHRKT